MKTKARQVAAAVLAAAGLLFRAGLAPASESPLPKGPPTLEALAQSYRTPEGVARFLRERIRFEEDTTLFGRPEYWQSPEEFLARGRGDCEDYALFTQALLERLGFEAFVFSVFGSHGYAHTVTVFLDGGRYNVVNQNRVIRHQAESLEELSERLYPHWTWAAVVKKSGHQGRIIREFFKTSVEAQLVALKLIDRST